MRSLEAETYRIARLREVMKAKPRSEEWRARISTGVRKAIAEGRMSTARSRESIEKGAAKLRGKRRPAEVVKKVRAANLGKKRSEQIRARASVAMRARLATGWKRILSPEARAELGRKISEARRGKRIPEAQRRHHSLVMRGRKADPEAVEARALAMRGRPQKALATRKGPSNKGSLVGILRSPNNELYPFRNLTDFVRTHEELFLPQDVQWTKKGSSDTCRAAKGLINLFGRGKHVNGTWKGWTRVSRTEAQYNCGDDLLQRPWRDCVQAPSNL